MVSRTRSGSGIQNALLNVMIEVRNDLLRTQKEIDAMAVYLGELISAALTQQAGPDNANQTEGRS